MTRTRKSKRPGYTKPRAAKYGQIPPEKTQKMKHLTNIASYLLVFAVLSSLLYIPCYYYIRSITRTTVIERYQSKLDDSMSILDSSIESFLSAGFLITSDTDFRGIYYSNIEISNDLLTKFRKTMLNFLISPYSFVSNFGLIQEDKVLFTQNQIYYDREYLTYDCFFHVDDADYFHQFTGNYCAIPATHFNTTETKSYDAVTIGYRCSTVNNMYLFIHYPIDQLTALFVENEVLDSSHIALYHGDTLLTSAGSLPQKGYETLSVVSNTGINLRVELSLSSDYIEQDLAGLQRLVKLFLALILLVICLWVIIFSWRLARPFNQISDVLYETGLLMGSASSQTKYSIDTLVGDIKKMGIKLSDYGRIIEEQNSRRRINILEKALYRGLYDEASRQSFLEAFPDFPARWQLAFIQYIPNEDPADLNYVQLLLSQQLAQKLPETILLPYSQDTLLAFISAGDEASPAKALEEARTYIQEQYPVSLSFTVGPIYDHYSLLPDAFQQLEYETITLRHFASPTVHRKDLPIPVQQLQAIYLALQNGDGQSAVSALRNGCADFRDSTSLDLATAKYSHQMIVYTLIRLKLENNILDIPIPNFRREDIRRLFDVELPACFAQFAARLNQQRTDQMKNLDRTIFAFIDKNIGNQQLCISMVTDHFQISAPTLQKRMNACCGKTFSSYVEDARMKKAGEMLLDTSLNIQEIAEAVGYTTANSFYKAYKRYYGEAPRETRQNKLHQQ